MAWAWPGRGRLKFVWDFNYPKATFEMKQGRFDGEKSLPIKLFHALNLKIRFSPMDLAGSFRLIPHMIAHKGT